MGVKEKDLPTAVGISSSSYIRTLNGSGESEKTSFTTVKDAVTPSNATTSSDGLMSSGDKSKLNGIESQANRTIVDSALSDSSTNPVQNKVVTGAVNDLKSALDDSVADLKSDISKLIGLADNVVYYPRYTQGGYYAGDGSFNLNADWGYTPIFEVEPNTTYFLNVPTTQYYTLYDEDMTVIPVMNGGTYFTTTNDTKYARISVYKTRQAICVVTKNNPYTNYIDDLESDVTDLYNETDKQYICRNMDFPLSSSYTDLGFTWDFSQPVYVEITNESNSPGYFNVGIFQDETLKQQFQKLIAAGDKESFTLLYVNTNGVSAWMGTNKYFTDYAWGLRLENENSLPAKISMYIKKSENPLHQNSPYSNNIIVSADGVGAFKHIEDAVAYAKSKFTVSTTPVTIFVRNGDYILSPVDSRNAVIDKGANRISIIGESRDGVKIILNNTPAHNNKIIEHGGPSLLKNLSFYNLWNEDGSTVSYSHNAYCIHNDIPFVTNEHYETVVENCYLYSEAFAPVGAGLQNKQTQRYDNVVSVFNSLDEREHGYNQWAPIYVHAPADNTASDCAVEIDDCTCIAQKGTMAITLPNVGGSLPYTDIPVTIRRTIGVTNGSSITDVSKSTHDLQTDSALNNVSAWNY